MTGSPKATSPGFILDVVDQVDPDPFYRQHRADGHGHPAYDPKLLLGRRSVRVERPGDLDRGRSRGCRGQPAA